MKTDIEIQVRYVLFFIIQLTSQVLIPGLFRLQRDAIENLKGHLLDLEQQQRDRHEHLEKSNQAIVRHRRTERQLQIASQRAEDEVEELKEAIDRDSIEDGRLDALKSALTEAEEEKKIAEASFGDSVNAMDIIVAKLKGIKRELAAKDAEIDTAKVTVSDCAAEEERTVNLRGKALQDKNTAVGQFEQLERDRDGAQNKRREIAAIILDYSEKASRVSPRVTIDARETPATLDRKLERLTRDLQRYDQEYVTIYTPIIFISINMLLGWARREMKLQPKPPKPILDTNFQNSK